MSASRHVAIVALVAMVAMCAVAGALSCNSLTGTNDLESVDCLGDCRAVPGISCGDGLQCPSGESCCVVDGGCTAAKCACSGETSCGASSIALVCDGPEDCSPSEPECCVTLDLQGSSADCKVALASTGAKCSLPCNALSGVCSGPIVVRLCHKSSDCDGDDRCCPQSTNVGMLHVCAAPGFAGPGSGCFP